MLGKHHVSLISHQLCMNTMFIKMSGSHTSEKNFLVKESLTIPWMNTPYKMVSHLHCEFPRMVCYFSHMVESNGDVSEVIIYKLLKQSANKLLGRTADEQD